MNRKFNGLAALLALSACIGLATPAGAVSLTNTTSSVESAVQKADAAGLLPDSFDGLDSAAPLTREQLCELAVRFYASVADTDYASLLDSVKENSAACPYTDTESEAIRAAWALGITPETDTEFLPEETANRETLFSLLYAALRQAGCDVSVSENQTSETLSTYADADAITDGAAVAYFLRQGVTVIDAEEFGAAEPATCAQTVVLASRALASVDTARGISSASQLSTMALNSDSTSVSWSSCGADHYLVYFYKGKNSTTPKDTELVPAEDSGTQQLDIPKAVLKKSGSWYWSVDALDCSGRLIGTSDRGKLKIKNKKAVSASPVKRKTATISENVKTIVGSSDSSSTSLLPSYSSPTFGQEIISSVREQGLAYAGESYSSRVNRIFGNTGRYHMYSSAAEASQYQRTITIPVWNLTSTGEKVSRTVRLTVNEGIADTVQQIFQEIYESDEKFPIYSIGGYNWRGDGSTSEHCLGLAIDINPDENYMCTNTGRALTGTHWTPASDPYSIAADSDVVRIFAKYGFTWGGTWRTKKDYMHFSYFGT